MKSKDLVKGGLGLGVVGALSGNKGVASAGAGLLVLGVVNKTLGETNKAIKNKKF